MSLKERLQIVQFALMLLLGALMLPIIGILLLLATIPVIGRPAQWALERLGWGQ